MAVKAPVTFPVGTFRASAKIVHERKDPEDGGVQKESHELFTEYTFNEDGSYSMHGYPPISEKGKIVIKEKIGHEYHVRVVNRVQTSAKGEWKPAEIDAVIRFAGDLKTFTWDAKAYHAVVPKSSDEKEEKRERKESKKEKK